MGSREGGKRLPERSMPQSVTQMKEEWRKGRSSLRTGKPSTRWVRGVKEHPNGEGPELSETSDAKVIDSTSRRNVPVNVDEMQKKLRCAM
jgi:hypothetical protein